MYNSILHVGFGKTGSSAIQNFLTYNNNLENNEGKKLIYCVLCADGKVAFGDSVIELGNSTGMKYAASYHEIDKITNLNYAKSVISNLLSKEYTLIFSQEDWGRRGKQFADLKLLENLGLKPKVIAYVRPQVEWLNSAWWQWYTWRPEFKDTADLISKWGLDFIKWAQQISQWENCVLKENLVIRPLKGDVVVDFLDFLNVEPEKIRYKPTRNNATLPLELIKLLKAFPNFRGEHSSTVDITLTDIFDFNTKAPWSIPPELSNYIISSLKADNEELLKYMSVVDRGFVMSDPRWWDSQFYISKHCYDNDELTLSEGDMKDYIFKSLEYFLKNKDSTKK